MPDNPRIEELRRRVEKDPASIAFAQLAEEYRRAGRYEDAIAACRSGLQVHPGYVSARVTLGRALIEMNDLDGAHTELQYVLAHAPENLAAIRGMAEIEHRRGNLPKALEYYQAALGLARHDPDLEQAVEEITRSVGPVPVAHEEEGLTFEEASAEFISALNDLSVLTAPVQPPPAGQIPESAQPAAEPPAIELVQEPPPVPPALERFLEAIHTYRQRRAV
jgi:tetratricopeptide (TPR) repeat protein